MRVLDGRTRVAASDVANFLACRHLVRLDQLAAHGRLKPARPFDLGLLTLARRGEEHERAVLERFRAEGLEVAELDAGAGDEAAAVATATALDRGVDVVYQGVLRRAAAGEPAQLGRPDFLVRADILPVPDGRPPRAGLRYEVLDAKLARSAKARAVLQSTFYSRLLAGVQGAEPERMHLALGDGRFASFKVKDYAAYERQLLRLIGGFVAEEPPDVPPADTYPEPVEHCAICRWCGDCATRRRADDDLSLVAGITKRQRQALRAAGVATRRGLATSPLPTIPRLNRVSLEGVKLQARLEVESDDEGRILYELLEPERDPDGDLVPNRGLLALPEPSAGDLFFDIEGARYYSEDGKEFGLQYLFGLVDTADLDAGMPRYRAIWSFDRTGEKVGFEALVDFITERRLSYPGLHVYHYNHYEPTTVDALTELHETRAEAVGRLMGRFATREDEVDELFRLGVFVDLYRVVRQGLRAGVESYSLKSIERLGGFVREVDLTEATENLVAFEEELDEGTADRDDRRRWVVAGYNEDDCRATLVLREWLEQRRADLAVRLGEELPRPVAAAEPRTTTDPAMTRIRAGLLAGVPDDTSARTEAEEGRALLADLLDWHRREAKPGWWRFFHVRTLSDDQLVEEPDAIGNLENGTFVAGVQRSVVLRFSFPPQEHRFSAGDDAVDPATGKTWKVWRLDEETGQIELKIGRESAERHPTALVERGPWDTKLLAARLRDLGERVLRDGIAGDDPATALLLRQRPNRAGAAAPLRQAGEDAPAAAVRLALASRDSYLPIQGPPGTGKTHTGAEQILALVADHRPLGITGPSHAVIENFLDSLFLRADEKGVEVRAGQRPGVDGACLHERAEQMTYRQLEAGLRAGELDVAAGTAWLWAREEFAGSVDTLFVDEAGQISLANTLAVAGAAKNLVLLGDPQQLAQPSKGVHPQGAGVSPLEHLLGERATMPDEAGLLLDRTWRMHPDLCSYTSEVFYDGRLAGVAGLERQVVTTAGCWSGAGLRVVEVRHDGSTNRSDEEAEVVARIVAELLSCRWTDRCGISAPISDEEILVVTPYNAQVREIGEALGLAALGGIRVGTVDKFQGRQAAVAIYSLATSSADEAPRGIEFLYDPHRLNVATSRAKVLAVLVASPDLFRVFCRTPRQMVLANALCRAFELG